MAAAWPYAFRRRCPALRAGDRGALLPLGRAGRAAQTTLMAKASRDARRKAHQQRFANRPSQIPGAAQVVQQIRQKEEIAQRQKRERLACSDNQYAELMGGEERDAKRAKQTAVRDETS